MSKPIRKFTKAEKLEIVLETLEDGATVPIVAAKYGIANNTLYNWRSSYYREQGIQPEGQGVEILTDEQRQIKQLKRELREAQLERDILKKAIGIFSKSGGKYSNS